MPKNFLKAFINFFRSPTAPCKCGGTIHEETSWAEAYYQCDRCGEYIEEKEFDRLTR